MSYSSENISLDRAQSNISDFLSGKINDIEITPFANLFYPYLVDNGGSPTIVSLTIDILNQKELGGNGFVNKDWMKPTRLRDFLPEAKPLWGFQETHHSTKESRAIGNAFCFSGQNLSFYIAPQGEGAGYIDGSWIYCKTNLTISVLDVVRGTYTQLYTFSNFSIDTNDPSRYFKWQIPEQYDATLSDFGLFGLFVVRIDVDSNYYQDAEFRKPIPVNYLQKNQALLQLLAYSGANELVNVPSPVKILKSPITDTYTLEQIFSHTIFDDLKNTNQNSVTDDQKRAIVADQIAVLFASQHPVVTADYYPSKIIGFGAEETLATNIVINKAITYGQRYPNMVDIVRDRLFGIMATYLHYNFISEIESLFTNNNQSLQYLRDPARAILMDQNGKIQRGFGVDGVLFNPYVLECIGSDVPKNTSNSLVYSVPISRGTVGIDQVSITDVSGNVVTRNTESVKVSFNVVLGEDTIKRIRYSVWQKQNLNYLEAVDSLGISRSHVFDFSSAGSSSSESGDLGDIIFARIDIEDENKFVNTFYAEKFVPANETMLGVTIVDVFQRQDGTGLVDTYYDYFGKSEINNSQVELLVSKDHGGSWSNVSSNFVLGDIGISVMPGRNHFVWNASSYLETNLSLSEAYVKLQLSDVDLSINEGLSSNIAVLNLLPPSEIAIRKLSIPEESEMWVSSSSSSSYSSESSSSSNSSSSSIDSSSSSSSNN